MKRNEHLEWAKKRALDILVNEGGQQAYVSFVSDMAKHKDLIAHPALELGVMVLIQNNFNTYETEKFINGFN